ncbi:MAG: multicopper oxidase domain-containing protein [Putridiphycobacter sp.]
MKIVFLILFYFFGNQLWSQTKIINMAAEMNKTMVLDDGSTTQYWGYSLIRDNGAYNASIPGPVLEVNKGDTVIINFYNDSPEDHTIHLHGLDVNQANDGVPTTSFAVHSQDTATYTFVANYEGTYLYHCHVLTTLHLTMGMYGMVTVFNSPDTTTLFSGGPSFTNYYNFLTSDMDLSWNNNTLSIPPLYQFYSDYFMVNGLSGNQLYNDNLNHVQCLSGDSTLLRLANIAYTQVKFIFPEELNAKAYLSDGRVLPQSFNCDTLIINPGERYSVLLTPTTDINSDIIVEYFEARNKSLRHTNYIKLNGDLGLNEQYISTNTLFPNPAKNTITFSTLQTGDVLIIQDLSGRIIHQQNIENYNSTINISSFNSGIYLIRYKNETLKFVKP